MALNVVHTKPCKDCPWRRKHASGWLGGLSAEHFAAHVTTETPLNCHLTLDREMESLPEEVIRQTYPLCAGALIVQRNMCKIPRDPDLAEAVKKVEPSKDVFSHPIEFLQHHNGS